MGRKWHVYGWVEKAEAGTKKDFANFETKEEAEKFLAAAQRERLDFTFEIEECKHPEHQ